jgi:alpha-glucosidase
MARGGRRVRRAAGVRGRGVGQQRRAPCPLRPAGANHDVVRHVTRLGWPQRDRRGEPPEDEPEPSTEPDLELGTRRARAAALLMLALPGGAYVYQGEELGLWEVRDLPDELLQDPTWERSGHTRRGRDGARVPIPWERDGPSLGFGPPDGQAPWLPQPAAWSSMSVAAQEGDPDSMLELYRRALRIRREHAGLGSGSLAWLETPADALGFERPHGFGFVLNLDAEPFGLPAHRRILLASAPLDSDLLPRDTAVWIELDERRG